MPNNSSEVGARRASNMPKGDPTQDSITVLIADDDVTSRRILSKTLHQAGFQVITAKDGNEARDILQGPSPPDIALLDWVMPGMTGLELCTMIEQEVGSFVYTVLVTTRTDLEDIISGLEAGAHEFLAKPVNLAEFKVRMRAAVRIFQYERALSRKNSEIAEYAAKMEALAEARARQLVHAERLATLGMLSAGVGHEIKNPLAYISGNLQVFERHRQELKTALDHAIDDGVGDSRRMKFLTENGDALLTGIREGIDQIRDIVGNLSRFARRGTDKRSLIQLADCVHQAVELSKNSWKYHMTVNLDLDDLVPVSANGQEIIQVLVNLLVNAADATRDREDGVESCVDLSLKPNGSYQRIVVADNGAGIPEQIVPEIFDPFFTTKKEGEGTGLGLAICSGIVEEHGGQLFFKNLPAGGACFVIDLPLA